jgi:23S rRNA pseudouridine1911/1915/1917 synthase
MALVEEGRGKHAVTHYRTLAPLDEAALVECRLETGRTHQVRVHLASIGHALLGDPVYGRTPSRLRPLLSRLGFRRQALHAAELGFLHPVGGQPLHFASPTPVDMRELIVELCVEGRMPWLCPICSISIHWYNRYQPAKIPCVVPPSNAH